MTKIVSELATHTHVCVYTYLVIPGVFFGETFCYKMINIYYWQKKKKNRKIEVLLVHL